MLHPSDKRWWTRPATSPQTINVIEPPAQPEPLAPDARRIPFGFGPPVEELDTRSRRGGKLHAMYAGIAYYEGEVLRGMTPAESSAWWDSRRRLKESPGPKQFRFIHLGAQPSQWQDVDPDVQINGPHEIRDKP